MLYWPTVDPLMTDVEYGGLGLYSYELQRTSKTGGSDVELAAKLAHLRRLSYIIPDCTGPYKSNPSPSEPEYWKESQVGSAVPSDIVSQTESQV